MHTQLDQSAPRVHFNLEGVGSPLVKSGGQSWFDVHHVCTKEAWGGKMLHPWGIVDSLTQ